MIGQHERTNFDGKRDERTDFDMRVEAYLAPIAQISVEEAAQARAAWRKVQASVREPQAKLRQIAASSKLTPLGKTEARAKVLPDIDRIEKELLDPLSPQRAEIDREIRGLEDAAVLGMERSSNGEGFVRRTEKERRLEEMLIEREIRDHLYDMDRHQVR